MSTNLNRAEPGKAIFLDRDGTIITDVGYLSDPCKVELLPGASEALKALRINGFRLFLFTNQSGVGRGFFPLETVEICNQRMEKLLDLPDPVFDGVCIAPEAPNQPVVYRKPSPRYIIETVINQQLDKTQCWMVGDKRSDVEAGLLAGINAARIGDSNLTGLPKEVLHFQTLNAFALRIIAGT
ncbi:D-glycero-alpha-D-manno-heptose-1,7-bisphosphate 7-phosphatase [Synoicihabitans lomoniglobus]|uniref:D,D-heptose 1,7-bisphosphate phosphatase n=1 Tax=Synoicihabitans lomoniglobus TaxID=2909285 RepID=A0AAF0I412_9BACT|nr:HAD-IIIA family hydrolase [Opitutaceae bacterium LMO-M01]WED67362.1 HAD-IIIA family hydrolase [Opitutaceae bacterium LMO-M01]